MGTKYKDSGIPWIGEIPSDWEVRRARNSVSIIRGGSPRPIEDYISDNNEGYNWIKIGDTIKGSKYIVSTKSKIIKEGLSKTRLVHKNDLILTNSMSFGEPYILKIDGCIHDGWVAFSNYKGITKEFLYYLLISPLCRLQFEQQVAGGVVQNLNIDKIGTTLILLPPLPTQQRIADFLDRKCAEIDELAALQETMITELKRYKQSVITETVTKGLDPNVPMKDSEVEWIGEIPEGWDKIRLKFLCTIQTGNQDTQDAIADGAYPFYVRSPIVEHSNKFSFEGEGILMAGDGAGAGRVFHHVYGKYAVHQRVYRLANFVNINSDYLFYFLSSLFCMEMDRGSAQSTVPSVRLPMLQNFHICIPHLTEQRAIADYLDKKCAEIDELIAIKQQKIEALKEYKKSVIFEYVTGKRVL